MKGSRRECSLMRNKARKEFKGVDCFGSDKTRIVTKSGLVSPPILCGTKTIAVTMLTDTLEMRERH